MLAGTCVHSARAVAPRVAGLTFVLGFTMCLFCDSRAVLSSVTSAVSACAEFACAEFAWAGSARFGFRTVFAFLRDVLLAGLNLCIIGCAGVLMLSNSVAALLALALPC